MKEGVFLQCKNSVFSSVSNKLERAGNKNMWNALFLAVNWGNRKSMYPGMHYIIFI